MTSQSPSEIRHDTDQWLTRHKHFRKYMESDQYKRLFDQPAPAQEKPPMSTAPSLVHNPSFVTEPVTPVQPEPNTHSRNLYQRLCQVFLRLRPLPKLGRHEKHKYPYLKTNTIYEQVLPILADEGILWLTEIEAHELSTVKIYDKTADKAAVLVTHTLLNADDPTDSRVFEHWPGVGISYDGKAFGNAIIAANKIFAETTFRISTYDPEEDDANQDSQPPHGGASTPPQSRSLPPRGQAQPQPKTPPPAPPPASTKAQDEKTAHPRDGLVADLKKLRDAAISAGITLMGLTSTQVQKMGVQELEKQVADTRSKVFKQIQQLEKQRFEEFGQAATPIADLSEMENSALALYVVSLHESLKPTEKGN